MKSIVKKFFLFLLPLLFVSPALPEQVGAQVAVGEPNSFKFQLGTGNRVFERQALASEVKAEFRTQSAGSPRHVESGEKLLAFKIPINELGSTAFSAQNIDVSTAPAPQQPPAATTPGAIPQSLREKMARLQALARQRQQEGVDISPVAEIVHGIPPLIEQQKFSEAEALADRALKLLDTSSKSALQQSPATTTPGAIPQSLQEKMARLQALARQRQQEGVDISPVAEIAEGVQPLIDQQKYSEAEALVDRALAMLSQSGAAAGPSAAGGNEEKSSAKPADAKLLPCPAVGAAIELASGDWVLGGDCTASGLSLHGDAQLWVEGLALTVSGNVNLDQKAELHILGGSFNQANRVVFEYYIHAKDNSLLELRDVKVATNAGVAGNLTSNYEGFGDSLLRVKNVQINQLTSWLLCNLHDRARLEAKDSDNFPNEVYPKDSSTARIEGPRSTRRVWLYFLPGSAGALANLPASRPFTFSFGRNTPGATGIGYQVDVVDGNVDFGIQSYSRSNVKISNVSGNFGIDCQFSDVTSPETLTGLKGGRQSGTYCGHDRVLELENVELLPLGWQLYSHNDDIPLASVAPVTVTDSLVNELGAFKQGRFEILHVQFGFAVIAAVGPSSLVHIRDSVINSQSVIGNSDGVVKIEDSEIYGALIQAVSHSRILLLNSALLTNERNPKCVPVLPPMQGSLPNACNPFNPSRGVQLVARDQGAIWVAGIDPIAAAVWAGDKYTLVGDAIFKSIADTPYTFNLRYRRASASEFTALVTGAAGPKRGQPLGQLDTTGLAAGDYVVELQLIVPGQDPVAVQRPFTIAKP